MSKTELVEFVAAKAGLTKEPIKIPAKVVASFKAGSKLKDALN